jgi:2-polyprenyl-3-methyl-5-hydroxy-6-metoxy-1,4-benzoquinol methylase
LDSVIKNKYGYYELKNKPSVLELKSYYSEKYFQENKAIYNSSYTKEEIKYFFNKIEQKYYLLKDIFKKIKKPEILDIGCGEGFALKYFKKKNWNVTGLDYSIFGCKKHNPDVKDYIMVGDIFDNLDNIKTKKKKYDVIWMDNVLEHILNPLQLLKTCYAVSRNNSVMLIEVPNDFSNLQKLSMERKYINDEFWVVSPDHISYFNRKGLINLCKKAGWKKLKVISDYPIEVNLLNDDCNYIKDVSKGKKSHFQRVAFENLLHETSVEKTNKLYEALADLGVGRALIGVFTK